MSETLGAVMPIDSSALSICGLRHILLNKPNEDAMVARPDQGVFAAIDGVSGRPMGHLAARILASHLSRLHGRPSSIALHDAFQTARLCMPTLFSPGGDKKHPGCVATALWVEETEAGLDGFVAHVGDTALLLVDSNAPSRDLWFTPLHSTGRFIHEWVNRGSALNLFLQPVFIRRGNSALLVTDGITKRITFSEVASTTRDNHSLPVLTRELYNTARDRFESDDISIVAVRQT